MGSIRCMYLTTEGWKARGAIRAVPRQPGVQGWRCASPLSPSSPLHLRICPGDLPEAVPMHLNLTISMRHCPSSCAPSETQGALDTPPREHSVARCPQSHPILLLQSLGNLYSSLHLHVPIRFQTTIVPPGPQPSLKWYPTSSLVCLRPFSTLQPLRTQVLP